jgi:uncharacterized protein (TIGR03083 family)
MNDRTVPRQLSWISQLSDAFGRDIVGLPAQAWDRVTNCAPWRVRDLAAHVVSSGEGFAQAIRRGLAGSADAVSPVDARLRRQEELAGKDPALVVEALRTVTRDFLEIYDGLGPDQLAALCFHRRGPRSVRWYAAHRLAEVAFHRWDLQSSVGLDPYMDEEVAALLLPTLIESNAPSSYEAGRTPERGAGERYLLVAAGAGVREQAWLVRIDPAELRASPGGGPADLTITGSAAALALLVYGRRDLPSLVRSGAVKLDGDLHLADRFAMTFPRP